MRQVTRLTVIGLLIGLVPVATVTAQPAGAPGWIAEEKIRAAYFSKWNLETLPGKTAEAGFNTAFIAFCRGADHFEKWSRLTQESEVHFFATLWFDYLSYAEAKHGPGGAGPKMLSTYRSFVHRNTGPHKVIVCPTDKQYWADWVMPWFLELAELDLEHGGLDGIIIDAELYGPLTTRPAIPVSFYMDVGACMCDDCFGNFLNRAEVREKPADVQWKDRHQWLVERELTGDYNLHLRDRVAALARRLEQKVHSINPDLLLGFMNWYRNDLGQGTGENYFLHGLLEGLKTPERPVMVWTESPEYSSGYGPHTDVRREHFKAVGDVIYIPGLYLEEHAPRKLAQQIHDLATHSDGYWIFTRHAELLLNSAILGFLKTGNDKIISDAPPASELPFLDLWTEYEPVVDVNQAWLFRADRQDAGRQDAWFAVDASAADWSAINVGEFWEPYVGVGWYRVDVAVPAEMKGKALFLAFGAVDEQAWVWCNGRFVGEHTVQSTGMDPGELWRTRFLIPVGESIVPGQKNTIAVRVLNDGLAGGIYLPVRLIARK